LKFKNIKNLIFDLDGVLIDSSDGVYEATNYALGKIGEKPRTKEEINRYIGYPLDVMFADFTNHDYGQLWEHFRKRAREIMVKSSIPLDGAENVIEQFYKDKYRMAIASTKIRVHIEKIVERNRWQKYFDGWVGADEVEKVKPAPDIFLKAMELLGGTTEDSIVVGDTVNDVVAAHKAGLKVVAIKSPFGVFKDVIESCPDIILDSINQLPDIIEK